jgi:hypothetical protein
MSRKLLAWSAASLAVAGCVGAAAAAQMAATRITLAEVQIGAKAHPQLLAEFGGGMGGAQAA